MEKPAPRLPLQLPIEFRKNYSRKADYGDLKNISLTGAFLIHETDEIVINATWGLGESLVGGTVTPDSYTLQKDTLTLLERNIATKTVMTIRAVQEVREVPIPAPMQALSALNDEQVNAVAVLVQRLESEMGWPVDIECAFKDDTLYLLQCRPITT